MARPSDWFMRDGCPRVLWTCVLLIVMNVSKAKRVASHEVLRAIQDMPDPETPEQNKPLGFYLAKEVEKFAKTDEMLVSIQADIKKALRLRTILREQFDATFSDTWAENKTRTVLAVKGVAATLSAICLGDVVFQFTAGVMEGATITGQYAKASDTFVGNAYTAGSAVRQETKRRKARIKEKRKEFVQLGAEMRTAYFPDVQMGRLYQAYSKTFRAMKNSEVYNPSIHMPVQPRGWAPGEAETEVEQGRLRADWCDNTVEMAKHGDNIVPKSSVPLITGTQVKLISKDLRDTAGNFKHFAKNPFAGLTVDELKKCVHIQWTEAGVTKDGYVPLMKIRIRDWRRFKPGLLSKSTLPIFEYSDSKKPSGKGELRKRDTFVVREQKEFATVKPKSSSWENYPGRYVSVALHVSASLSVPMTVDDAKKACAQIQGCKGFSHSGVNVSKKQKLDITFGSSFTLFAGAHTTYLPKDAFFALKLADERGWVRVGLPHPKDASKSCGAEHCAPSKAIVPLRGTSDDLNKHIAELLEVEKLEGNEVEKKAVGDKITIAQAKAKKIHGNPWSFAGRLLLKGGLFALGFFTSGVTWIIGAAIGFANATAAAKLHYTENEILNGNTAFFMGILAAFEIEHFHGHSVSKGERMECDIVKRRRSCPPGEFCTACPEPLFCLTRGVFVQDGEQGKSNKVSTKGVCVKVPRPLLPNGATCSTELDCRSGYCDMKPYVLPKNKQDKADKALSTGFLWFAKGSSKVRAEALVEALMGVCRQPCQPGQPLPRQAECHVDSGSDLFGVVKDWTDDTNRWNVKIE